MLPGVSHNLKSILVERKDNIYIGIVIQNDKSMNVLNWIFLFRTYSPFLVEILSVCSVEISLVFRIKFPWRGENSLLVIII